MLSCDTFIEEVRRELCIMGLPLNNGWQPEDRTLRVWYVMGYTIREVARMYRGNVKRYEDWVNKRGPFAEGASHGELARK